MDIKALIMECEARITKLEAKHAKLKQRLEHVEHEILLEKMTANLLSGGYFALPYPQIAALYQPSFTENIAELEAYHSGLQNRQKGANSLMSRIKARDAAS